MPCLEHRFCCDGPNTGTITGCVIGFTRYRYKTLNARAIIRFCATCGEHCSWNEHQTYSRPAAQTPIFGRRPLRRWAFKIAQIRMLPCCFTPAFVASFAAYAYTLSGTRGVYRACSTGAGMTNKAGWQDGRGWRRTALDGRNVCWTWRWTLMALTVMNMNAICTRAASE